MAAAMIDGEEAPSHGDIRLVISASALIGVIFAVLLTLLAPLMAVIYNAIVDVFGGLRVDLDSR